MRGRRLLFAGALALAVIAGAVATVALDGAGRPLPAPRPPRVSTATIERTTLTTTVLTAGTLGDAPTDPVVDAVSGTYTWLPQPGSTIARGAALYDVDDEPVVLFSGPVPAWRPFQPGMSAGPDVHELEANLIALGDASGLFTTPSDQFTVLTVLAIERWQAHAGLPVDGVVDLGRVIFLPGAVVVGAENAYPGQPAAPGGIPYAVTSTTRTVSVPLNPDLPPVHVGQSVSIHLPTGARVAGGITAVGPAPPSSSPGSGPASASSGRGTIATVTPTDPAATGTENGVPVEVSLVTGSAKHVLAAPISALLALAGGGYGVEVDEPSGAHRLVGVTTGMFTGTRVQVAGRGIGPGTKVVVSE